jgi:deoxyribose-phosphate aldolase
MVLRTEQIAKMFDLSCVRTYNTKDDIVELIDAAKKHRCGQVSVLQCFIDLSRELLKDEKGIKVVGNISFPSGSDITELKVLQAAQMVGKCDEIDMVMNVCYLKSGMYSYVEEDVKAVKKAVGETPLKVIIESALLDKKRIEKACEICINAGAAFVKTGTGWTSPTTVEQVKLIKSIVGDAIAIKASGGIKNLNLLLQMYASGATRFGVNMKTGIAILNECIDAGGSLTV